VTVLESSLGATVALSQGAPLVIDHVPVPVGSDKSVRLKMFGPLAGPCTVAVKTIGEPSALALVWPVPRATEINGEALSTNVVVAEAVFETAL
jgi:hypothetical protein